MHIIINQNEITSAKYGSSMLAYEDDNVCITDGAMREIIDALDSEPFEDVINKLKETGIPVNDSLASDLRQRYTLIGRR